jgi:hypothetical protein
MSGLAHAALVVVTVIGVGLMVVAALVYAAVGWRDR